MAETANYLNGIIIKKSQYGLNAGIHVENFIKSLQTLTVNASGWANININEKKEVGKHGDTHYMKEYIAKPKEGGNSMPQGSADFTPITAEQALGGNNSASQEEFQDLPF